MSDITTRAVVEFSVNDRNAVERIQQQKRLVSELQSAYAKAASAGDTGNMRKLEKELRGARGELRKMQQDTKNVDDVLKRLDRSSVNELRSTLRTLEQQMKKMERGTEAWVAQAEKIRQVKDELQNVSEALAGQESLWDKATGWLKGWQTLAYGAFSKLSNVSDFVQNSIQAYADMDSEMANVRKYTGMSADEVERLNESFKEMDTRTSREDLNRLAQEAGRLGKDSVEDVLGFVKAADKINVALDDLGEGATLTLSKLTGIFGDEERLGTEKALLSVGSVINELSQNCAASAPYLAEFSSRIGGVAAQAGMSVQDLMAFASVLDASGQKVEMSSTALSQMIVKLYKEPAKYASAAGIDVQHFSELVKTDMNGALIEFLETLKKTGKMDVLAPMLADMGLTGQGAVSTISTLAEKGLKPKVPQFL